VSPPLPESSVASPSVNFAPDAPGASRAHVNLALSIEAPDLDEWSLWSAFESLAVQMSKDLPAAASATALDELQERLVDQVCGPKWAPARCLPAPFACPGCGAGSDFARKGRRTPTAALGHRGGPGRATALARRLSGLRQGVRPVARADGPAGSSPHGPPDPGSRRLGCPDVVQPKRSTFSIAPASQSHGSGSPGSARRRC
jgi:hypothetical protein